MTKVFAPGYEQDESGWYRFPSDVTYRRQMFPHFTMQDHPAKANTFLVEEIVRYVSEPNETVCDIMAGSGTIMIAALNLGRNVVMMELEKVFIDLILKGISTLNDIAPGIAEAINLFPGSCAKILPIPGLFDHVIYSPPYSSIFKKKNIDKFTEELQGGDAFLKYSDDPENFGNYSEFLFFQKCELLHKKVLASLPSGGTLTIVIKDHMAKRERVFLGQRLYDNCIQMGFVLKDWFKWKPPGSAYLGIKRARGEEVVNDEDIIIVRRP
uniref:Putative methyltransferase n=1 Tax=viral metagenome TaxID=1070528 RepID=A0A6M3LDE2_9ZZZZ